MNILDFIFGKSVYENHEHKYTIPYNTHGINFMKCEICGLMDDVTDHTNYRYEKAKREYERIDGIYNHNKSVHSEMADISRRISIVSNGSLPYAQKIAIMEHLQNNYIKLKQTLKYLTK